MTDDPCLAYSAQVLAFALAGRPPAVPLAEPDPALTRRRADSLTRLARQAGRDRLVLLGLGARALASVLANDLDLLVCDLSPERVRLAGPGHAGRLFVDASPWAHQVFLASQGWTSETCLFAVNPEQTAAERQAHVQLHKRLTSARPRLVQPAAAPPPLGAAAILHPADPGLEDFFASLPADLAEVVVVWDQPAGDPLPRREAVARLPAGPRLAELRRPLAADFAAQRNAMLEAGAADWILYLDGDERLAPADWRRAASLAASGLADGWLLPRLTFWPDAARARMGYGLWPDPQLRLFRRTPALRFERPVHERLTGLAGPPGLALDLAILHESYLRKDAAQIAARLKVFDQAGALAHRQADSYPCLPVDLLRTAPAGEAVRTLMLGEEAPVSRQRGRPCPPPEERP